MKYYNLLHKTIIFKRATEPFAQHIIDAAIHGSKEDYQVWLDYLIETNILPDLTVPSIKNILLPIVRDKAGITNVYLQDLQTGDSILGWNVIKYNDNYERGLPSPAVPILKKIIIAQSSSIFEGLSYQTTEIYFDNGDVWRFGQGERKLFEVQKAKTKQAQTKSPKNYNLPDITDPKVTFHQQDLIENPKINLQQMIHDALRSEDGWEIFTDCLFDNSIIPNTRSSAIWVIIKNFIINNYTAEKVSVVKAHTIKENQTMLIAIRTKVDREQHQLWRLIPLKITKIWRDNTEEPFPITPDDYPYLNIEITLENGKRLNYDPGQYITILE